MDSVIDYIVANYIWFLVGLGVLIMVIIGYIADKTDFGHKKKDKKEKINVESEHVGPTAEELEALKNKTLGDALTPNLENAVTVNNEDLNVPLVSEVVPSQNAMPTASVEDLGQPLGTPISSVNNPYSTTIDDLSVPFGNQTVDANNNDINNSVVDENLNVPLDYSSATPVYNIPSVEENIVPEIVPSNQAMENLTIPSLDSYQNNDVVQASNEVEPVRIDNHNYDTPIVPEVIMDTMIPGMEQATALKIDEPKGEQKNVESEEDIWKF